MADEQIVDDEKVTDEDLANLKAEDDAKKGVESALAQDEPSEESPKLDEEEKSEMPPEPEEEKPTFAKEFPNIKGDTPEEYARSLEEAYKNSSSEAIRLKQELETKPEPPETDVSTHPAVQYAESMMQNEVNSAFEKFSGDYPQVRDMDTFEKFRKAVGGVSDAFRQAEGRTPTFEEAYYKTAELLGWQKEDKLGAAAKGAAASPKTNSATKSAPKSTVTDKQLEVGRHMFPGKTDSEIRKELEAVKS
jgi:hypothetical protein